jgi:DNA modification methylase
MRLLLERDEIPNDLLRFFCPMSQNNRGDVWRIATQSFSGAHFATYPEKLVEPCILAGCPAGGVVLDPFGGSMTTLLVARRLQCKGVAIELNPDYIEIGLKRFTQDVMKFSEATA